MGTFFLHKCRITSAWTIHAPVLSKYSKDYPLLPCPSLIYTYVCSYLCRDRKKNKNKNPVSNMIFNVPVVFAKKSVPNCTLHTLYYYIPKVNSPYGSYLAFLYNKTNFPTIYMRDFFFVLSTHISSSSLKPFFSIHIRLSSIAVARFPAYTFKEIRRIMYE